MPKNPRGYPDEIELKVRDEVNRNYSDEDTFNTEKQQQVAHDILDHWPIEFKALAVRSNGEYTRQTVANVIEDYFGPVGDDITFEEIEDRWPGYAKYEESRTESLGSLDLPEDKVYSKREVEIYVMGREEGWEAGWDIGYQKGREEALDDPS